jgi:hypothetical protein
VTGGDLHAQAADRGDVDDVPATLVPHCARGGLAEEEQPLQIEIEDGVPGPLLHVDGGREEVRTGVVHQDVEPSQLAHDAVDQRLQLVHPAQVSLGGERPASELLDLARDALQVGELAAGERHVGARLREHARRGLADAPAGPRDQRDLSLQREP